MLWNRCCAAVVVSLVGGCRPTSDASGDGSAEPSPPPPDLPALSGVVADSLREIAPQLDLVGIAEGPAPRWAVPSCALTDERDVQMVVIPGEEKQGGVWSSPRAQLRGVGPHRAVLEHAGLLGTLRLPGSESPKGSRADAQLQLLAAGWTEQTGPTTPVGG